jgi:hypothetical protein
MESIDDDRDYNWTIDELASLWTPDALEKLYQSIMSRTLHELLSPHTSPKDRLVHCDWVYSETPRDHEGNPEPFSFEVTCAHLRVDPAEMRQLINDKVVSRGIDVLIDTNAMGVADKRRVFSDPATQPVLFADAEVQQGPSRSRLRLPPRHRTVELRTWVRLIAKLKERAEQIDLFGGCSRA